MRTLTKTIIAAALILPLSACQSFSLDKDRAAEKRKQELCGDISTRDLPHCSGSLKNKT